MLHTPKHGRLAAIARTLTVGLAAGALASVGLVATAQPASADTTVTVNWTKIGIYPRESASMDSAKVGDALADGDSVTPVCEKQAEPVSNGSQLIDIWDQLPDGTWLPNAFLDTGSTSWTPGVPRCDDNGSSGSDDGSDYFANMQYNRTAAVNWALGHAQDAPGVFDASGCTWFVSNAFWAGGFPTDDMWTPDGEHKSRVRTTPGSVAAWAAPEFLEYITEHYDFHEVPLDFNDNSVPGAEAGDFIAYDWEGDGNVDHLALVTNISSGNYPEVSEWGVGHTIYEWIPGPASYVKRGWTYSENDSDYLQARHPNIRATLYHVQGGFFSEGF